MRSAGRQRRWQRGCWLCLYLDERFRHYNLTIEHLDHQFSPVHGKYMDIHLGHKAVLLQECLTGSTGGQVRFDVSNQLLKISVSRC